MSEDWNIHCLDCESTHTFDDANHRDAEMAELCKHASAIAAIAPTISALDCLGMELRTRFGRINTSWFSEHAGHRLVPINEYGALLGQCPEYVECTCGSHQRCTLAADHDGVHELRARGLTWPAGHDPRPPA